MTWILPDNRHTRAFIMFCYKCGDMFRWKEFENGMIEFTIMQKGRD